MATQTVALWGTPLTFAAPAWATPIEGKQVFAPLPYVNDKGEEKVRFIPVGVRVNMVDGSWYCSQDLRTWTQHRMVCGKRADWDHADKAPREVIQRFTRHDLAKNSLLRVALVEGLMLIE